MNNTISITPRRLMILGLFGILAVMTYGFAAANTMPASTNAGDGQSAVSGYTVSNVHYTLNTTTPSNVDSVSFGISPSITGTAQVRVSLNGGTSWIAAANCSGTTTITCTAPAGTTALAIGPLRVVAAQ